jgi:hypothetical protein
MCAVAPVSPVPVGIACRSGECLSKSLCVAVHTTQQTFCPVKCPRALLVCCSGTFWLLISS